jgi:haloalkane dehalogenase
MKDFVFTEAFLDTWARHWPHAEVHRFNAAGHYVLEDAADPLIALIEDFVRA